MYTWEIFYRFLGKDCVKHKTMPFPPQKGFLLLLDDCGIREVKSIFVHFDGSTLKHFEVHT
jgi:hypothetical protein